MKRIWPIGLIVGVATVTAGYLVSRPEPIMVKLHSLEKGTVEATVSNTRAGTIRACQRSRLSMPAGGTVTQLNVKAGDRVKRGEVLLQLRDNEYQAALEQAEARQRMAVQKRAEICFGAEQDQRELTRLKSLYDKRLTSEESLERIRTTAQMSSLACKAAQAQIEESRAAVKLAQASLNQMQLKAPFDGIVAEVNGELGEYVTPSPPGVPTPPAIDLIDDQCLYVRAPIDEVDTARIRVGMPARVTLDAYRGQTLEAIVTRVSPYVQDYEKQARTVDVEANIVNVPPDITLLVGYSADLEIILASHAGVVQVPSDLIVDSTKVYRYDPDTSTLHKVEFQPGLSNWVFTESLSGLAVGERIVSELDQEGLEDGISVRIAP
ncbi:MAG: efflux RND transporter periplasmic adaptor subunit [Hahellaceae bacterium]|nr:efflux RND transporter periplasmic adaptor subunit [Hahellaceae bacterium]